MSWARLVSARSVAPMWARAEVSGEPGQAACALTRGAGSSSVVRARRLPLLSAYVDLYRRSLEDPEGFWADAAAAIDWVEPWERVLDDSRAPLYRWFTGGRLNTCHNALDRHADGLRAEQIALIYDSPVTDTVATFTYRELRDTVARFAGALRNLGVERGDRVIVYM